MQDDSHLPSDDQFQRPSQSGKNPTDGRMGDTPPRRIPAPLQNWQVLEQSIEDREDFGATGPVAEVDPVVEIDGEATIVDTPTVASSDVGPAVSVAAIADQQDRLIGLGLDARRYVVEPGETVTLNVELLNNGPSPARFEVNIEGWIDEAWTPDLPVRVHLTAGEARTIQVTLTLPRGTATQAGEVAFAVTAQTARYVDHVARVGAILAIARHTAFQLGSPQPRRAQTSWLRRSTVVHVPLHNQSNHAVRFALRGFGPSKTGQPAHFTFYSPQAAMSFIDDEAMGGIGQQGHDIIHAEPGASLLVPVQIEPADRPWVGLFPRAMTYRLAARLLDEPAQPRTVEGQIGIAPLIGPWQMGIAAMLALVALVGMGLTGLALLLALRSPTVPVLDPAVESSVAATPVPPAVFVIQLEQPAPTRAPDGALPAAQLPPAAMSAAPSSSQGSEGALAMPIAPVVRADQVTAPGEPTPAGLTPLQPLGASSSGIVVATPTAVVVGVPAAAQPAPVAPRSSASSGMTYGEMFREIGLRYDWDWRLLAAQAYIESGFDSLALSSQGDMGLMQIRPPTWQEWAPQVTATDPFDSYSNVLVAARYLDYLRELLSARGYPQLEWTLVAYNWGPDEVLSYLAAGGTWESLDAGLRSYAEDIQRISQTIPSN